MTDDELRAALLDRLRLRPCHLTGMHNPNHDPDLACTDQLVAMARELLDTLDIATSDITPALHDNCHWCHAVPAEERYREQVRRDHRWAGAPISDELAAPGDDVARPGDADTVLAHLTEDFEPWQTVTRRMREAGLWTNTTRYHQAVAELVARGDAERRDVSARRTSPVHA